MSKKLIDEKPYQVLKVFEGGDIELVAVHVGGYSFVRKGEYAKDKRGHRRVWSSPQTAYQAWVKGRV